MKPEGGGEGRDGYRLLLFAHLSHDKIIIDLLPIELFLIYENWKFEGCSWSFISKILS